MTPKDPKIRNRLAELALKKLAKFAARNSYSFDAFGHTVRISNNRAVEVLTRAYVRLFRSGAHCHAERLTHEEARSFPANRDLAEGNHSVLAVGYDIGGNCSYSIRHVKQDWLGEREQWDVATMAAVQEIYELSMSDGLPIGPAVGRC